MNREIKLRAWNKKLEVMELHKELVESIEADSCSLLDLIFDEYLLTPASEYVLMQYICQKDKKGKEIYEGDLIQTEIGVFEVVYEDYMFNLLGFFNSEYDSPYHAFSEGVWTYEIIGNIYENPDIITYPKLKRQQDERK